MKIYFKTSLTLMLAGFIFSIPLSAQFDDLYYDPASDELYTYAEEDDYYEDDYYDEAYTDGYEDGYNEAYDDEYSYATRINRFRRSSFNIDYFNPVFMVGAWNSPFYYGGYTGIASLDYYNWRRMNRFNSWNRFGWGFGGFYGADLYFNTFGWNSGYFYDPFCPTPFFGSSFGRYGWGGGYFGNGFGYGSGFGRWGNAYGQHQVVLGNASINRYYRTTESNGRYYGSRNTTGTVVSRNSNLNSPRVTNDRSRVKTRLSETTRSSDNRIDSRRKADVTTRRTTKVRNSGITSSDGTNTSRTSGITQTRRSGNAIYNRNNSSRINSGSSTRTKINNNRSGISSQRSSINRSSGTSSRPSMNTNRTNSSINRTGSTGSSARTAPARTATKTSSRKGG